MQRFTTCFVSHRHEGDSPPIVLDGAMASVAYLDSLSAKAESLRSLQHQSAAELDALLPSILDRAFKGEL